MVPAPRYPWEIPVASNTAAPLVIPVPGGEQLGAERCISAFLPLCFSMVTLVTEQKAGVCVLGGDPVAWSDQPTGILLLILHPGPLARDFGGLLS